MTSVNPDAVPTPLTHEHGANGVQTAGPNAMVFSRSSLTGPNNVYLLSGLIEDDLFHLELKQITTFAEEESAAKNLDKGTEFWFDGAEGRKWLLKPPGFKAGREKSLPAVLIIHGGPQAVWEDSWSTRWSPIGV